MLKNPFNLKWVFLSLFYLLYLQNTFAFPKLVDHNIIIDTDCAADDFMAISFLLSRPEIEISAIIVSEGTLEPEDGVKKVISLLQGWGKQSIPVYCNKNFSDINPSWRKFSLNLKWGLRVSESKCQIDIAGLIHLLDSLPDKTFTFLCLGSLSTIASLAEKYPQLEQKTTRIIWYNKSVFPPTGFNYECNREDANKILESGNMRIDVISNLENDDFVFDKQWLDINKENNNALAMKLADFFNQKEILHKHSENHFIIKDQLAALYIFCPELFDMTVKPTKINLRYNVSFNLNAVKDLISDLIHNTYSPERNVVFNTFPSNREQYNYDVRQMMDSAIARYGNEEWKACVMTDEFHGHLGVFSIVGAKMGIKAREFFGVGPDQLHVISHAGTNPPYSCLNDGIQVSTGSTLGQGLISVISDSITRPEATFTYNGKSISLKLKDKYLKIVNDDIREGIVKFGLMDDGYWKLVRQSALRYWLEWDRNEIFEILTMK